MALDPKEADKLRRLLKEINDLSKILGKNIDLSQFRDLEKSADAIKALFAGLNKEVEKLNDNLDEVSKDFGDLIKKIKSAEEGSKKTVKAFDNFGDIARQIYNHQKGSNELSADEADLLVTKIKNQKKRLEDLQKQLKLEQDHFEKKKKDNTLTQDALDEINDKIKENLKSQEKINDLLSDQNDSYDTLLSKAKDIRRQQENMQKALGLSGAAVDGIGNAFKKVGLGSLADQLGLDKAKAKMKDTADRITDGGKKSAHLVTQFRVLGVGIGSLGKSIAKNLTDPLVLAGLAAKGVAAGVKGIQKGVGLLKKGISSIRGLISRMWSMVDSFAAIFEKHAAAGQFAAQNFSAIGSQVGKITAGMNSQVNLFMRWKEAGPALKALVDGTGMMAQEIVRSTNEAHNFSYWLGYSAEETGKLYALGQLNNKSLTDTVAIVRGTGQLLNLQYKTSLDLRKVEQEVAKASATVKYNLSSNPKALAEAAFFATKLGMSLKEIESAAESTLNFEQSIQDQLTYQTMTGKELNLDAYQQAALSGDAAKAAQELDKLIQAQGPSLKGNVLQQEAFAKALGISKDQLAQALTIQELSTKIQGDKASIEKALQHEMAKGLTRDQAAAKLAKDGIATSLAQSKKAEAFSRWLESFRDWMTMNLWPLFKAIFSPANIKVFMTVLGAVRPLMAELGKAISAFFSPENADKLVQILKQDVIPTIMTLAKMLTDIAGGAGKTLLSVFNILGGALRESVIPLVGFLANIIKDLAPEIGVLVKALAGGIASVFKKVNDNKEEIKDFIMTLAGKLKDIFDFISGNMKEIGMTVLALKGFSILKSSGVFELVKMAAGVARLGRGSNPMSPMFTKDVSSMGFMDKLKNVLSFGMAGNGAKAATTAAQTATTATQAAGGIASTAGAAGAAGAGAAGAGAAGVGAAGAGAAGAGAAGAGAANTAGAAGKFGGMANNMLKGAGALLILSGAIYVAAKAFQEFAMVEWEDFGKGVLALGVLALTAFLLGQREKDMLKGALAVAALGAALIPAAAAFLLFDKVDPMTLITVAGALTILGVAAAIFGSFISVIELGIIAIGALGLALIPLAAALLLATPFVKAFGEVVEKVMKGIPPIIEATAAALVKLATEANPIALAALGFALIPLSVGLTALGEAAFIFAAASGVSSLLGGGGGLFGMLENLVALSNIDISKAAKSFKDGLLEFASIDSGISFSHLEDLFDDLEDAIEEIDIEDLVAFCDLAGKNIAGAARSLIKGIAEFANMNKEGGKLVGQNIGASSALGDIKTGLVAYFANLEDLFDEVEDAIDELDIDALIKFGDLANISISAAVKSLSKGINAFSKMNIGDIGSTNVLGGNKKGLIAYFANLEKLFDEIEDAIAELDIENLTQFAELGRTNLTNAVKVLEQGITSLLTLQITFEPDSDKILNLRKTFRKFDTALGELDMDNVVKFAELADAQLGTASTNLKAGIESLASQTINVSDENLVKVQTALESFNSMIGAINMDNVVKFAELAKADLVMAGENLIKGVNSFAQQTITATAEQMAPMEKTLEAFDTAIGAIQMDNVVKFGELAKSDLSLAATNFKAGIDKFLEIAKTIQPNQYDAVENFQEPIQALAMALSVDSGVFDKVSAFAKMDLKNFVTTINDFKKGLDKFLEISNGVTDTTYDSVSTLFSGLNEIFSTLDVEKITTFATSDMTKFSSSVDGFISGINKLNNIGGGKDKKSLDISAISQFFGDLNNIFVGVDLTKFLEFANTDFSKLPNAGSNIKKGLDSLNNISLSEAISQLNSMLPQFIPQINSLINLDSTKILTLADAICKLSGEFVKFNEVLVGFKGDSLQNVLNSLGSLNASLANIKTTVSGGSVSNYQDGTIQMQDGVIQVQDSNLNPNGGLVISKYQKGQLQPVAQGIREDNVYLTPNRPSSGGGGTTVQDNSQVVAAIQALTNAITNSQKEVVVNLNGQTVGKIITPTIVESMKKQGVNV